MKTIERKTCRICDSPNLKPILSFGEIYISTFVEKEGDNIGKAPLELVLCEKCQLLQLKHTAPQELIYAKKYWYKSGINPVIVKDLQEIVSSVGKLGIMEEGDTWIDVGANDGTLLKMVPIEFRRVGVEPATNLLQELRGNCDVVFPDFWENYDSQYKAKTVTAIGMFYDSEDPNKFIGNVKKHLAPGGVFVSQFMTLRPMIEKNDLGNIVHEHLEYYSYESVKNLFERNGLEIFRVEENGINGGSYRLYARHLHLGSITYSETQPDYEAFAERIEDNKTKVVAFIEDAVAAGKKVYGYGASTKGNTILQYYGLDNKLISGIADPNPEKIGKFTVGTHILVVPEEEAREKADYFLILPWGFEDSFVSKEKGWVDKGGAFLRHTPNFAVIDNHC